MDFAAFMETERRRVDAYLEDVLPPAGHPPVELHEAIRYTVFAGGKRVRPIMTVVACGALGGDVDACLPGAAAIEMIHVSSLIHDDLPCMDDSDTRRGKPSCHMKFGESTAVLAGDWLLVYPFEVIGRGAEDGLYPPEVAAKICATIARGVCTSGIVAGQVLDLDAESRKISGDELRRIHELKTAALMEACARVGAAVAQAPPDLTETVAHSARALGLCFQVVDDILDVIGDAKVLGKPTGADSEKDKNTYVSLYGLDTARQMARDLADEATKALEPLPPSPWLERSRELIDYIVSRTS
jgi:geranylgeranyl diphosphate synthase type II